MFNCEKCGFVSNSKKSYDTHRRSTKHFLKTGEVYCDKFLYCEVCDFRGYYKSKFEEHLKTKYHIDRTTPPIKIKCKLCNYWSYSKSNFNQHKYRHKNNENLNIKQTEIKVINKDIETINNNNNNNNNNFIESREILKDKINEIIKYLYQNKIDPNKYFNYEYYRNKNIELSIVELNDFYQELNCILLYN